jgi:hypothetical protein
VWTVGALLTTEARAQSIECAAFVGDAARVCTAAVDATRAFHPLLGVIVSGGNPVLGTGGPLGAGQVALTARANAVQVSLPRLSYDGSSSTVPRGREVFAPAPVVEAAVGVYGGLPSGLLAIAALGSVQLVPAGVFDDFRVDPDARHIGDVALGLGIGARVGLLREIGALPGVSVSVMRRDLPTMTYGDVTAGDEFQYAVNLHATSLRLAAGKQLTAVALAGGLGWSKYTGDARIELNAAAAPGRVALSSSRWLAFLDAGLGLGLVGLVAEGGYQFGTDEHLTTDFEDFDTTDGTFFAGLGLRVGL